MIESIEQTCMTLELNDPLVQAALDANEAYHKATEKVGDGIQTVKKHIEEMPKVA